LPFLLRPTTTANNITEMKIIEPIFPEEWREYENRLKDIISYAESVKSAMKLYQEKEDALNLLAYDIGDENLRNVALRVLKGCGQSALDSLGDMDAEIAELKKKFKEWL
jgi:hypothetical protein